MNSMISGCILLLDLRITNFTLDKCEDYTDIFLNCLAEMSLKIREKNYNSITSFTVNSKIENIQNLVYGQRIIITLNIPSIGSYNIISRDSRIDLDDYRATIWVDGEKQTSFREYYNFETTGLHTVIYQLSYDDKLPSLEDMFYDTRKIESVDLSELDTSEVTTMSRLFRNSSDLKSVNVNFDTTNVLEMKYMFEG